VIIVVLVVVTVNVVVVEEICALLDFNIFGEAKKEVFYLYLELIFQPSTNRFENIQLMNHYSKYEYFRIFNLTKLTKSMCTH
jgi:hypothetical protein